MSTSRTHRTHILFVCLGNICRSPLAEGVFRDVLEKDGLADSFHVDSAGTGAYHVGEPADPRSLQVARDHGVTLDGKARKVEPDDLDRFDHIVAMDRDNLRNLEAMKERHGGKAQLHLLREFDPEAHEGDLEVPDPYYGGPDGFQAVYSMIHRSCKELLQRMDSDPPRER